MSRQTLRLKKNEDRRLRAGHLWIYSNEIDTAHTPLKNFQPIQDVIVESHDKKKLGIAYVNPHSLISGRLLTTNPQELIDSSFFLKRFTTALALRTRLYPKPFYRLVFGESDGLPGLVVDRYDQTLVMQLNTAGMDVRKEMIIDALKQLLPETNCILLRNDSSARRYEGLPEEVVVGFGTLPETLSVEENNVSFTLPSLTGQKTGWFYDHRLNRSRLKNYVKDERVLDVFSYLGAWGIEAACMGAKEVVCVDTSSLSAEWIARNAALNQVTDKVKVITDDAFDALKKLHLAAQNFSVIIIDPPAFVKKQKDTKEGILAYQRINELALKLLEPNGILVSCSCSMHVSDDDFTQVLRRASLKSNCELQILERGSQAPDHPVHIAIPETNYLKMVILRKIEK